MPIRQFELYHGAVLVHLIRSDRPLSIRLVEADAENWSVYTIDLDVDLFVTYSRSSKPLTRTPGTTSWQFVFNRNQLRQLNGADRVRPVFAALVCVDKDDRNRDESRVCLLKPDEIEQALDLDAEQSSVTIRRPKGGQFQVVKGREEIFKVPAKRFETWEGAR